MTAGTKCACAQPALEQASFKKGLRSAAISAAWADLVVVMIQLRGSSVQAGVGSRCIGGRIDK